MHDDLLGELSDCFDQIVGGDTRHEREVAELIERCERAIAAERGTVGLSQRQELAEARTAWRAGLLQLALLRTKKALVAGEVPKQALR